MFLIHNWKTKQLVVCISLTTYTKCKGSAEYQLRKYASRALGKDIKQVLPGQHQQGIQTKWTPTQLKQQASQLLPSKLSQEPPLHQNHLHPGFLPETIEKQRIIKQLKQFKSENVPKNHSNRYLKELLITLLYG